MEIQVIKKGGKFAVRYKPKNGWFWRYPGYDGVWIWPDTLDWTDKEDAEKYAVRLKEAFEEDDKFTNSNKKIVRTYLIE